MFIESSLVVITLINRKRMNKILIITLFLGCKMVAQNFSGVATYQFKPNPETIKSSVANIPNLDDSTKKMVEEKMRINLSKTFILTFDKINSIYKEEQKLDLTKKESNGSWSPYGMDIAFYKNFKDNIFITEKDLMSKQFFVKDQLTKLNWVLSSETKKIGNYNCQKANAKIVEKVETSEDNSKSTNFLVDKDKEERIVTAWYTTEIPISNGPTLYWGLPGLILEIEEDGNKLICSKIVLNPMKKSKIESPKSKDLISTEDYEKIVAKKMKELETSDFMK